MNFPTEHEERQMLLGLTQHLTGNEGRQKKEKKTTKRVAAATAAAKEKELQQSAPVAGRDDQHSHDVNARSSKRQRRAVVIKAEQKVRFTWSHHRLSSKIAALLRIAAVILDLTIYQEKERQAQEKAKEQARAQRALRRASSRRIKEEKQEQQTHRSAPKLGASSPPSLSSPARSAPPQRTEKALSLQEQEFPTLVAEGSDANRDEEETSHVGNDDTASSVDQPDGAGDNAMDLLAAALGLTPPAEQVSTLATSPLEMAAVAAAAAAAISAESTKDDGDGAAAKSDGNCSTGGDGSNKAGPSSGCSPFPAPNLAEPVAHTGGLSDSTAGVHLSSVVSPGQLGGHDTEPADAKSA